MRGFEISIKSAPSGAAVEPSASTIAVTGRTERAVSLNFASRFTGPGF